MHASAGQAHREIADFSTPQPIDECLTIPCMICCLFTHAGLQGKLTGRLLDFSTPQPIDECLAILGDSMVRQDEVSAVMGVYAKAVKDGDVSALSFVQFECFHAGLQHTPAWLHCTAAGPVHAFMCGSTCRLCSHDTCCLGEACQS